MKDAINQQNKEYRIMQDNLYLLSTYIYNNSLHNVKNCLKNLWDCSSALKGNRFEKFFK